MSQEGEEVHRGQEIIGFFACTGVRYMRLAGEWTGDDKVAIARTTDKENDTVFDTCSLKYEVCKRF